MRALTSLDSMFLATEVAEPSPTYPAWLCWITPIAVGKALTRRIFRELFAERLHLLPPLRWRLVDVPLGLGHPGGPIVGRCRPWTSMCAKLLWSAHRPTRAGNTGRSAVGASDGPVPTLEVHLIHGPRDGSGVVDQTASRGGRRHVRRRGINVPSI